VEAKKNGFLILHRLVEFFSREIQERSDEESGYEDGERESGSLTLNVIDPERVVVCQFGGTADLFFDAQASATEG